MKNKSFKKRHLIIPGIIVLIAIFLFAAPRIAKTYIIKHSPELIGRKTFIGKIRINYFTGTLRINDLKLYEADGTTAFVSFRQLKVNLDYLPLFSNEFVVRYVSLDDPYIQVIQNGSKFNFDDLIPPDTVRSVGDTVPEKPSKYIINDIKITSGFVKYTDQQLNHTISLDKVDLKIPGFTWNSDSANLAVDFRFVDGGGLYSKLEVNQVDSTYSINLRLDSLNLGIIEPYAKSYLKFSKMEGYLTNNLTIRGSLTSVMKLSVRGVNDVYGFGLTDTLNRKILSFDNLSVDIDTFLLDRNRVRLNSIKMKNPFILFELIDSTNNWMTLIKPSPAEPSDTTAIKTDSTDASGNFLFNYPPVTISGGKLLFADKTLKYPFEYHIDNLNFESSDEPGMPGKIAFRISAGLNGTGSFLMKGLLDPDNIEKDLDLSLEVNKFRMKDLDAYFKHYFGFPVTAGIMNFKTGNKIREKSLVSDNTIYFRKFTLAERIPGKTDYKVPLRLAIGILSDKDGVIDLKAPVKMKGAEVKVVNLGRIIFKIIGNLFVKAAVSPFNLLSGISGSDPASLKEIKMGLTESQADEADLKSVDAICDILNKKPQLNVDFIYCINPSKATDSLAYILSLEEYMKMTGTVNTGKSRIADTTLWRFIAGKLPPGSFQGDSPLKTLCRSYISDNRLNSKIDSLRIHQTKFLGDYLKNDMNMASERFRVISSTPDSLMPVVSYPYYRVFFNAGPEN